MEKRFQAVEDLIRQVETRSAVEQETLALVVALIKFAVRSEIARITIRHGGSRMSDQIDKLIARNHQLIAEAERVRKETAKRLARMRVESENLHAQTLFLRVVCCDLPDIRPYKSL